MLLPNSSLVYNFMKLCFRMGKKHKHEKHHKHSKSERHSTDSMDYEDPPVLIPKLIVKFGQSTPERSQSPAAPRLEQNEGVPSESYGHHHRHKDKKKKKKKDKKKSHERDKDRDREHRRKKKRKRDKSDDPGLVAFFDTF